MKKYIIAYASLLAFNIYAAEEQQQITIYNNNVETIGVDLQFHDLLTGKNRGCHLNGSENDVSYQQKKSFDIVNKREGYERSFTLFLPNSVIPQYVKLNITEDGLIRPGDTVTVSRVGDRHGNILIETPQSTANFLCKSYLDPIVIGSDPTNFSNSTPTMQQIHIANTDLFQVSVVVESIRKRFSKPKSHMVLANASVSNEIAKQVINNIEEGYVYCFKIEQDSDTTNRLKLIIPEAKQEVLVNINEGEINSGDILQVCWSEDKQHINIKKIVSNSDQFTLLARLYSRKQECLTATFG